MAYLDIRLPELRKSDVLIHLVLICAGCFLAVQLIKNHLE